MGDSIIMIIKSSTEKLFKYLKKHALKHNPITNLNQGKIVRRLEMSRQTISKTFKILESIGCIKKVQLTDRGSGNFKGYWVNLGYETEKKKILVTKNYQIKYFKVERQIILK